jgi:hypothetical protein
MATDQGCPEAFWDVYQFVCSDQIPIYEDRSLYGISQMLLKFNFSESGTTNGFVSEPSVQNLRECFPLYSILIQRPHGLYFSVMKPISYLPNKSSSQCLWVLLDCQ